MNHLRMQLRLSRQRQRLFYGMQKSMTTFPQKEKQDIPTPEAQAVTTDRTQNEKGQEEGEKNVNTETGTSQRNRNTFSGRAGTMEQAKPDDEERG